MYPASLMPLAVFFVNSTATTDIYTYRHPLSLHDALPICGHDSLRRNPAANLRAPLVHLLNDDAHSSESRSAATGIMRTRPSTTVTPSARSEEHTSELPSLMRISYAVFCLKKKNTNNAPIRHTPLH